MPETIDVFAHGSVDDFLVQRAGESRPIHVDHRLMATYIRKQAPGAKRIRLVSCSTGGHAKGVAQHLANKLGVAVLAPTDIVHLNRATGDLLVGPSEHNASGTWIEYTPQRSSFRGQAYREPSTHETAYDHFKRQRAERTARDSEPDTRSVAPDPTSESGSTAPAPDVDAAKRLGASPTTTAGDDAETIAGVSDIRSPARARAAETIGAIPVTRARGRVDGSVDYFITEQDGRRILDAVRAVEGIEALPYKQGVLIRDGGQEWYLQYRVAATDVEAGVRTPSDGTLGLPAANVGTVELWGFRGVREIQKAGEAQARGRKEWTEAEQAEVVETIAEDPLLEFGHVGISFDGGKTIHSLTPATPDDMPLAEVKRQLKDHQRFPGRVRSDPLVFARALRLAADLGWNTRPVRVEILLEPAERARLHAIARGQEGLAPGDPAVGDYRFPPKDETMPSDGTCRPTHNCATYPRHLGLPIPEETGNLRDYMPALERWSTADGPIDARGAASEESPP